MTFKLKHSLKKHQLVHKTEFGHTCDFCGKKFKVVNIRKYHNDNMDILHFRDLIT